MSAFTIRAEGGHADLDRSEVRRALLLLIAPGERHELRALPSGLPRAVASDDPNAAVEAAEAVADQQLYLSLNPIREGERASKATVARRRWLLVDIDPVRADPPPAGYPSHSTTEAEKANGYIVAAAVAESLLDRGWPAPLVVDSGNGWYLLYRLDLPADKLAHQLCKAVLEHLAVAHGTAEVKIDKATHDAPRIARLPGTWNRKGPDTPDRPHRLARIWYEPDRLDVVPVELLQALTQPDPPPNGTHPGFGTVAHDGAGKEAYVRSAIERECCRVLLAPKGERNHALNRAAFALGQFASWPEMREGEARAELHRAADRAGLAEREILPTIASGWSSGAKLPRPRPADPQANGKDHGVKPGTKLVTFGNEVTSKAVTWMWRDRIAPGFITIFAGKTGIGKSFALCDVSARLTTGRPMPFDSAAQPPCGVLFISEDPIEYVLAPRLMELKADMTRMAFMTWEAMAAYTLGDVDLLERVFVEARSPRLIIFDPPSNFLGGKDEHKNAEVRSVVMKLVAWLDSKGVAAVFVTHVNRRLEKGVEALDRIMGSVAWGTTARIAIGFAADRNSADQCLCAGIKNNLGPKAKTLAYRIRKTDSFATVDWIAEVDTTADEAFSNSATRSVKESIEAWMMERFREKRSWKSDDLKDYAMQSGYSYNAYKTYRTGVRKRRVEDENGEPSWWWDALPGWPPEKTSESTESTESCDVSPSTATESQLSGVNGMHRKNDWQLSVLSDVSALSGGDSGTRKLINEAFKPF